MPNLQAIQTQFNDIWNQALAIWIAGGWCMPPIALTAFVMFALGIHLQLKLRATGFLAVSELTWRRWIDHPKERRGPIGDLLTFVTGGETLADNAVFFHEVRATALTPFERDLRVMKVCIAAAPLLGLLGTVTGMLGTFEALASGSGGEKTMALVAHGISEALITTETGLVIALPGLFFQYQIARKHERYKAFLAHLETACAQTLHKRIRSRERRMRHDRPPTTAQDNHGTLSRHITG